MTEPLKSDHRMTAIALSVAAAACLLAAGFSTSWLANARMNDIRFGPRGCVNCCLTSTPGWTDYAPYAAAPIDRECSETNSAFVEELRAMPSGMDQTSGAFAPMGWVTLVVCTLAALGLLAAAALAFLKKTPELPIAPTTVALLGIMVGLITGCVFVATKPGPPGFVGVAWGFWAFGAGAVAGIAGAQMLAKVLRPPDPDLLADAMNPDDFST